MPGGGGTNLIKKNHGKQKQMELKEFEHLLY